jgi:hypothetical protein
MSIFVIFETTKLKNRYKCFIEYYINNFFIITGQFYETININCIMFNVRIIFS